MLRKYRPQHQDIESSLVIPDEDSWTGIPQVLVRSPQDAEADARCPAHGVLEGPAGGPLRAALGAEEGQDEADDDTVDGAQDEHAVGS